LASGKRAAALRLTTALVLGTLLRGEHRETIGMASTHTPGPERRHFLPAAGHAWLLPFYDPLHRLLGGAAALDALAEQASLAPGQRVLDIGCGTGTLAIRLSALEPDLDVVGLDPDPQALARARAKAQRAGASVTWKEGFADALPFPDASFDQVFSSFMFHHLDAAVKRGTLSEVTRVLRPGGSLHLLDFGGSGNHSHGLIGRLFHRSEHLRDNLEGRIPLLFEEAGLEDAHQVNQRTTLFGSIAWYRGDRG
jgi:SAM-dependent methyltransferase